MYYIKSHGIIICTVCLKQLGFVEQGDTVKTECTGSAPVDDISE